MVGRGNDCNHLGALRASSRRLPNGRHYCQSGARFFLFPPIARLSNLFHLTNRVGGDHDDDLLLLLPFDELHPFDASPRVTPNELENWRQFECARQMIAAALCESQLRNAECGRREGERVCV